MKQCESKVLLKTTDKQMTMICFVPCFPWLKSFQAHLTSIFVFFVKEKQKSSLFEKVKRNENLNLTTLTVNYAKDIIAKPTFPPGVGTGGTIWLPGIQVSLSLSLGPSFASISNRCIFRYTATMKLLSLTMTCELRSLLSSSGPYDLKVHWLREKVTGDCWNYYT